MLKAERRKGYLKERGLFARRHSEPPRTPSSPNPTVSWSSSSFSSSRNRMALTRFTARSFQASSDTSCTRLSRAPQRGRFSAGQRPGQQGCRGEAALPFQRCLILSEVTSAKSVFTISFQNIVMTHRPLFQGSFWHAHFKNFLLTVRWPHM